MGWQPIETAPKDGSVFLIRQGNLAASHAFFRNGELKHIDYSHTNNPTHWMPLPHPPEVQ